MTEVSARALMAEAKFYEGYSRYNDNLGRYETWDEAVERVMNMHRKFYADKMTPELEELISLAEELYKKKYVLGAQRALQFGGDQLIKHQMRMYNCFDVETKFITKNGTKAFSDFSDGDSVTVLTHTGSWKPAKVKAFGTQMLNKITFSKGSAEKEVYATSDHRWILHDGSETTALKVGDRLFKEPNVFEQFDFDSGSFEEKLYWAYGYVYGDGTVNGNHSYVRLCGNDAQYESRFTELGFKSTSPLSISGDVFVYTGKYKKTLPDVDKDSPELIRAFVAGYLAADGIKSTSGGKKYIGIQATGEESINFIRKAFPIAGVNIISENDLTGQETNFGIRPYTIRFVTCDHSGSKYNSGWKVRSIEEYKKDTVWCLEVEDDKSFILDGGIVTGNCVSSYADRAEFFGEFFYVLLCGAGAGFSVQKHHVSKLPKIQVRKGQAKIHVVTDDIEGWATAVDVLLSSFFVGGGKYPEYEGRRVYFDTSKIRPKGAEISGGFKAPGPEPLRKALDMIEHILNDIVLKGGCTLTPIQVYDICMFIADAVLSGGVRRSATICLFSPDDEEMLTAKTGNWFTENPQRKRSNNSAVFVRNEVTREEFATAMKHVKGYGEPGFVFVESRDHTYNPCVEIGKYPVFIHEDGTKESGWQGCVSYDTKLITKNGIRYIGDVAEANEKVTIWNGKNWSEVSPIQTGENRTLYRVTFSDGSYLDATENHKFMAKTRFQKEYSEYTTLELIEFIATSKYAVSVPRANITDFSGGISEEYAYDYGFILGDGTASKNGKYFRTPRAEVYEHEYSLGHSFSKDVTWGKELTKNNGGLSFKNVYFTGVDKEFSYKLKYNEGLPVDIFGWDKKSIEDFFAGWIDSDGTKTVNGFRIYGTEDKIRDGQLLLTKIGIDSSVNCMAKSGEYTNKSIRKNDVWYIQVSNPKQLKCNKFELVENTKPIAKSKNQVVRDIVKLDGLHNSYCFEESELHQGVFNNVLTKQCNLTEGNGSKCSTKEEFLRMCIASAILGTLQAGYTDFSRFMPEVTQKIFERESLIGCSITGWMNNPDVLLNEENMREGATLIREVNRTVAKLIGINPAARTTCGKPAGNSAVLLQTVSATDGEHSKRYLRHVTMNKEQEVAQLLKEIDPYMVEESVHSAGNTDYAIAFPVIAPEGSKFKSELDPITRLDIVKKIQQNWVEAGTDTDLCVDPTVRHNISNTIIVPNDKWDEVEEYLYENRKFFAGVSLLSASGDKDYNQAPMTEVKTAEEIVELYGEAALFASGLIVDTFNGGFKDLWDATYTAQMDNKPAGEKGDIQADWIRRFENFANNYFGGDLKKAEYCLKDVHLLHKWTKIQQNYVDVNFVSDLKEKKYTDIDTMGATACAGGQCSI